MPESSIKTMTEKVKVVVLPEAKEEVYNRAYGRFSEVKEPMSDENMVENLSHFKEYSEWVNNILPNIRSMSGYSDSKGGTYQVENQTVVVEEPRDRPMDGRLTHCSYVKDELVEVYDCGALDAMEGRDRYESVEF